MDSNELKTILKLHARWLAGDSAGLRAYLCGANLCATDLRGADLRAANLRAANLYGADLHGANLRGVNLDFAAIPLSCGGLSWKIDRRLLAQFLYHVCSHAVEGCPEWPQLRSSLLPLANEIHRDDVSKLV